MNPTFTPDFFASNRQRLRKAVYADGQELPIVVTAAGLLQRSGDNTFPFHQDSNFWYLTGISHPDVTLVMDGQNEYLIVPGRSASREAFDGSIQPADLTHVSGISDILPDEDGWQRLSDATAKRHKVAVPLAAPAYIEQYGLYTNPARAQLQARLQQKDTKLEFIDIRAGLARLRTIKQAPELAAIQQAIDVTVAGLEVVTAIHRLPGYHNEYEAEADLSREFRLRGAAGHAFAPIIAGGKRACTLHNVSNEGELTDGNLVIFDVGAEVSHYAADITRTVAFGVPTHRQREIFDAVADVQAYALTLLKPGTMPKDYESAVETYMGTTLQKLGLIQQSEREAIRQFYPHSTSHFMGLDVHDVGDYSQPLQEGTVLTCEPGIYISEEGIGVRIEDDVLITATGAELLSGALPKTLA